jgi:hypothetical protein
MGESRGEHLWYDQYEELQEQLDDFAAQHNDNLTKEQAREIRPYVFESYKAWQVMFYLSRTFDSRRKYRDSHLLSIPEVIVLYGKKDQEARPVHYWSNLVKLMRQTVSQFLEDRYKVSYDNMELTIGEEVIIPFNNSFRYTRENITPDTVLEYGMGLLEDADVTNYKKLVNSAREYVETGDLAELEACFSDEYLKNLFDKISEYDEADIESVIESESFFWAHYKRRSQFEDEDDYYNYRQSIVDSASQLDFKKVKSKMKKYYLATLKNYLDEFRGEYIRQEDFTEWETNLLQPIIVSVSDSYATREKHLQDGANMAMPDISVADMEKLIELVSKIKSNPASLSARRLGRVKGEFYRSVEDLISGRAEAKIKYFKIMTLSQF